jgi:hypothetical protein
MHSNLSFKAAILLLALPLAGCFGDGDFHAPLENSSFRATPLHFGLHVTPDPENNPIDPPERFEGYHVATDYEVSAGELEGDVPVYAICPGKVLYSGFSHGYGGLVIHTCKINRESVTVLYGHLSLEGLPPQGSKVAAGQVIGLLAPARSYESDGNRKHLHLGIHKGTTMDLRGYVQTEEALKDYIDPLTIFPAGVVDLNGDGAGEVPYWQTTSE